MNTLHFYYRLLVATFVALFAVWGMLRWFEFDKKRSFFIQELTQHLVLFRYPQRIQSPFFALVHLHIRQASILYPLGIACFALLSCILLCNSYCIYSGSTLPAWLNNILEFCMSVCSFGILLFWGTIFGADQKNHSYRFLMRLGIHEGKIWWSRMLIPFLCYVPVLLCWLLNWHFQAADVHNTGELTDAFVLPMYICAWFAPAALGAFFSISFARQIPAFVFTVGGTYILLLWALFCGFVCGTSPWLSLLPICLAFFLASRLQAKYWLRDINTFRSRLLPLLPVIGVVLAVWLVVLVSGK